MSNNQQHDAHAQALNARAKAILEVIEKNDYENGTLHDVVTKQAESFVILKPHERADDELRKQMMEELDGSDLEITYGIKFGAALRVALAEKRKDCEYDDHELLAQVLVEVKKGHEPHPYVEEQPKGRWGL